MGLVRELSADHMPFLSAETFRFAPHLSHSDASTLIPKAAIRSRDGLPRREIDGVTASQRSGRALKLPAVAAKLGDKYCLAEPRFGCFHQVL